MPSRVTGRFPNVFDCAFQLANVFDSVKEPLTCKPVIGSLFDGNLAQHDSHPLNKVLEILFPEISTWKSVDAVNTDPRTLSKSKNLVRRANMDRPFGAIPCWPQRSTFDIGSDFML